MQLFLRVGKIGVVILIFEKRRGWAEGGEQRAKGKGQRAESKERGAE
jgi:hypothetical protein